MLALQQNSKNFCGTYTTGAEKEGLGERLQNWMHKIKCSHPPSPGDVRNRIYKKVHGELQGSKHTYAFFKKYIHNKNFKILLLPRHVHSHKWWEIFVHSKQTKISDCFKNKKLSVYAENVIYFKKHHLNRVNGTYGDNTWKKHAIFANSKNPLTRQHLSTILCKPRQTIVKFLFAQASIKTKVRTLRENPQ